MANAIFTTKPAPIYDDTPEERYHFPRRYLSRVEQTVDDWIVYYEPRRADSSDSNRDGRQVYFAMARVKRIEPDPTRTDHSYAIISDYVEFAQPVSFRLNSTLVESSVRNNDGTLNPGRFIMAIRPLPPEEFEFICRMGMAPALVDAEFGPMEKAELAVAETQAAYGGPRGKVMISRPVRDAAFTRVVRHAYNRTCAMTGLQLINGGGRCEIEAAHIKAVEFDGPDSPRNGIALSRTIHWMFDRGLLSVEDDGRILVARNLIPEQVKRMLNPDGRIILPTDKMFAPHRSFLRFHRERCFKGN